MSRAKYGLFISLAVLVGIIVYSAIMFLLVEKQDNIFYMSYGFTIFALVCFWASMMTVLIKPKSLDIAFLNEPYMAASLLYLVAQFVFGIWAISFEGIETKIVLSIDILMAGVYLISILFLVVSITMNKTIEKEVEDGTSFMKGLNAKLLDVSFENKEVAEKFAKFMDDVKFAPMFSGNEVVEIEAEIGKKCDELLSGNLDDKKAVECILDMQKLMKKRGILLKR